MSTKITYTKLQPSHALQYRQLRLESLKVYPDSFGSTYEEQQLKEKLAFEHYIEQAASNAFIIGAFSEDQLIGICGYYGSNDKRCQHRGEIIQLYVQPQYQHQQIGRQLLLKTIEKAAKNPVLEQIELQVITNNTSAHKLYEKIGFQSYGLHQRFYKKGQRYFDLHLMVLSL